MRGKNKKQQKMQQKRQVKQGVPLETAAPADTKAQKAADAQATESLVERIRAAAETERGVLTAPPDERVPEVTGDMENVARLIDEEEEPGEQQYWTGALRWVPTLAAIAAIVGAAVAICRYFWR